MKAIEFKEVNVRIAENQPEYETLPVYIDINSQGTPTTMCFKLEPDEIKQVNETGNIWVTMLTFGQSFHPIKMSFLKPGEFTEPEQSQKNSNGEPVNDIARNLADALFAVMRSYESACPERYYGDDNVAIAEDAIKEFIDTTEAESNENHI